MHPTRSEADDDTEQGDKGINEVTITRGRCLENYKESSWRDAGSSPCGVDSRMGQRVYSILVHAKHMSL